MTCSPTCCGYLTRRGRAYERNGSGWEVAALSGLRWGELAALRRCDVDLDAATVRVPRKLAALKDRLEFGPPKSAAGVRVVALPAAAVEPLASTWPSAVWLASTSTTCATPAIPSRSLRGQHAGAAARMGHATMRAALIYQHATSERDREIASAMDRRIAGEGRRRR